MTTYLLIHGSWHGAWCWEKVIPLLKAKGHEVLAPDLPGHGEDKTPLKEITLQSYVDCVGNLLNVLQDPAILVGHSMGGIVISQVAQYFPTKVKKLIYVAAFLPKNNQSLFDVAQFQATTRFVKMMKADEKENTFYFSFKGMYDFAYHQYDKTQFCILEKRFCVDPLAPLQTPLVLTEENFGRIPRVYIECEEDRAILLSTQRKMLEETPCTVFSLQCDHSPFYSDPEGLVNRFLR